MPLRSATDGLTVSDAAFAAMLGKPVPPQESPRPFHVNSTLTEVAETWLGRLLKERAVRNFQRQLGVTARDETNARMFEEMANNMPLRSLVLFSRGAARFPHRSSLLIALLNKRLWSSCCGILATPVRRRLPGADRRQGSERTSQGPITR